MKEQILTQLPPLLERLDDIAQKVYDPTQIWLESIQFADYVSQLATHMNQCGAEDCNAELTTQLLNMTSSFKQMGENALTVLDEMDGGDCGA
jgi:hypothetical protein